jgi:hypothetical protein
MVDRSTGRRSVHEREIRPEIVRTRSATIAHPRSVVTFLLRRYRLAALLAIVAAGFATAPARGAEPPAFPELEKLAKAYKIEIVATDAKFPVKCSYGTIDGKAADRKAVEAYAALFVPEFNLYPPDLIKRSKLTRVVLCTDLTFADQRRNAIPDFEHETLYLDVACGASNKPYMRKVIHHEFYHVIDLRDDGHLYKDERWAGLNPADFKYGTGGKNAQGVSDTSTLTDKYPGFLNHYSTTGVEEDKAEVFANLVVDAAYVAERAKKDRVLTAKVERMKELMTKFCPDVKEAFWEKAAKLKREE